MVRSGIRASRAGDATQEMRGWRSSAKCCSGAIASKVFAPFRLWIQRLGPQKSLKGAKKSLKELQFINDESEDYNVTTAAGFLRQQGFLVLLDALQEDELEDLRASAFELMERIFFEDPEGSFGGGAGKLPHRYSLGDASGSKSNFHRRAFAKLIDLPSTTPLLTEIFGSRDYLAAGSGGDVALAGAIEAWSKRSLSAA